jgi:predicted nucleic acid-binding protein
MIDNGELPRSASPDYDAISRELDGLQQAHCGNPEMHRALEVQRLLAHKAGLHHRSVKIPDLLVAATAELAALTVLHYDEDYERVAAITGQNMEWVVERGSID